MKRPRPKTGRVAAPTTETVADIVETSTPTRPGTFTKGHDPRRGGGKPGRSGRKPDKFKRMCRNLTASDRLAKRLRRIIRTGTDRDALAAAKFMAEFVHTKPASDVNVRTTPLEDLVNGSQEQDHA